MTAPVSKQHAIQDSLGALMAGVIDYAGLFPPARLDMSTTIAHYAGYLGSADAWALGRIIVPTARLDEFEQHAASHLPTGGDQEPWQLAALVAPAGEDGLDDDLRRIAAFNEKHAVPGAGGAAIGVIELRAATPDSIDDALDRIPDGLFPFFEIPVADDPRGLIAAITGSDAGAKVRTGGVKADAYPTPEHLARFIAACAAAEVPFKATAGLHQPLCHYSEAVGTREFGFLNVFTAGVLALKGKLTEQDLLAVLTDEKSDSFDFSDESLHYHDHELSIDRIETARRDFAISFGSCSFTEPMDALRT